MSPFVTGGGTFDVVLELDPADQNSGATLSVADGNYGLVAITSPAPPPRFQWASSADTEGARLAGVAHENRTFMITLDVGGDGALADLAEKIGKLHREGGTLKYTSPFNTTVYADLHAVEGYEPTYDYKHYEAGLTTVTFSLPAFPYLRGVEVELGTVTTETSLPCIVKTVTGPVGDWSALGRLVLGNDASVDQSWVTWGIQSLYYSADASAALFYEAEDRTALGGSATAAGPSGASGAGSNVMRNTGLLTAYQAVLSTQASGGGAHLSHIGSFRVYAQVQVPTTNTGTVTVALEWSEGDFLRSTRNTETALGASAEGKWVLVDCGIVSLDEVVSGTQRWEGRILAKSTVAGDDIDIDYLLLVPVDEGSGVVSAVTRSVTPTAYVARDDFTGTTAGNALNARAAPVGGSWATSGAATDLVFADPAGFMTSEHITRSASGTRYAVAGTTNYTNVQVQATVALDATLSANKCGVGARWTDANNHLVGRLSVLGTLEIVAVVASTETVLATTTITPPAPCTLKLTALANGTVNLTATYTTTGAELANISGSSSLLATGGTLATGEPFLADVGVAAVARSYDDFLVSAPPVDAAIFGSQSLEIRHDRVIREDSGGTLWPKVSSYIGDYLKIPPAGAENRSVRVIAKFSRTDPFTENPAIDDGSMRLFATPRFLTLPG